MEEDEGKNLQANLQDLTGLVRELLVRQETLENIVQTHWREEESNGGKVRAESDVMAGVEHLTRGEALTGSVNLDVYPGTRQGLGLHSPGTPPSVQFGRTPLRVIGADIRVTDPGDELALGRLGEDPLYTLSESTTSHRDVTRPPTGGATRVTYASVKQSKKSRITKYPPIFWTTHT